MTTLYHATTHAPVHIARLLRDDVFVRAYVKPEIVGHLYLPEASRQDRTQTLWEVILSSAGADEAVGTPLLPGMILTTLRRWPSGTGLCDAERREVMCLSVAACGLRSILTYQPDE